MIASALAPLLVAAAAAAAGAGALPPAGRYEARLCVAASAQPPNCGPVEAQVDAEGGLVVRVHDFAYHLAFQQGLLIGVTTHGSMQVAEFVSSYRWIGQTLMFGDRPRGLNYELQLGTSSAEPAR